MSSDDGLRIDGVRTPGLGDSTYVVSYQGLGILVDPQRDVHRFLDLFPNDVSVRWVLETHLHNDYISGGRQAARVSGAELVLPAAAAPAYRHTPAFHHEDIVDGEISIRPIHTPGHTPEHTSYLLMIDGEPSALFSGGSLLVGSAGRSDLLGLERAASLARLQYLSVTRLAALPDLVGLYPTHGEGSFCSASGAGKNTSTIGDERVTSPIFSYPDEAAFVTGQLAGLQPYPSYYARMGPANTLGYGEMFEHPAPEMPLVEALERWPDAQLIDARSVEDFGAGHIPGSLGVELRDDFGTWVGWLIDIDRDVILIMAPDQDSHEATTQLARIGFDAVHAVIRSLDGWTGALQTFKIVDVAAYAAAVTGGEQLLDVRAPNEWDSGHLAGSLHRYVPDIAAGDLSGLDPQRTVWIGCGSGFRAGIATRYLEAAGFDSVVLRSGGIPEVRAALGG